MAESGERRMLFDTRGRRRNVIKVVYVLLALLMGGSLFLTVGPFSLSEIGGGGGSTDATEIFHDRAERIEERLAKDPQNPALLLELTRARIQAGAAQTEVDPQTGLPGSPPPDALDDYESAEEAWNRYLAQAQNSPEPGAAQLVAQTFFGLAERGSNTIADIEENLSTAVRAQRIAAEASPNSGSLSSLAIYEYFNGNMAAGDKAAKQAVALSPTKPEKENAKKQLGEFRQRAKQYVAQIEKVNAAQQQGEGGGAEQLQNPFGGFGSGTPGAGG